MASKYKYHVGQLTEVVEYDSNKAWYEGPAIRLKFACEGDTVEERSYYVYKEKPDPGYIRGRAEALEVLGVSKPLMDVTAEDFDAVLGKKFTVKRTLDSRTGQYGDNIAYIPKNQDGGGRVKVRRLEDLPRGATDDGPASGEVPF